MPTSVAEAFAAAGLVREAVVKWGTPPPSREAGVYVVALTPSLGEVDANLPRPPFYDEAFQAWLTRCPALTLDGVRPTADQLKRRIERFWLPDEAILYVGLATQLSSRVRGYYRTPIGARQPHSGGYFLKLLSGLDQLWVHFAPCADPESAESDMINRFCEGVSDATKAVLIDPLHPFPFANLEWPRGTRKSHGLRGARESRSRSASPVSAVMARPRTQPIQSTDIMPKATGENRTQRVTAVDLRKGRIRIPVLGSAPTKQLMPPEKAVMDMALRDRVVRVRWDPKMGPDRERSGVLRIGSPLRELVREGEVLTVVSDGEDLRID